ncbi:aspartate aminotransferase family protein [Candidatus Nitrosocosmicus agrestis]|jgi:acetylornithine/LysW-gamma-L-lysine aminotransferase|uniref:aspartate aminotransferase family protein n=1 Tax=Candidatus Nitrosocosmicus agrestis TaxID=2563600 RepID=UPI001E37CDC3|nr:aminotransferase class III-fold pyridoxal phosphate-dependent enzyme [Candidatus Nitrosocosmicus sp. SS]
MMQSIKSEEYYVGNLYQRFPVNIVKGKGCKVWDKDGKEYLDCMGGYGVALVGHCNDRVVNAITNQVQDLITCHMSVYNEMRLKFLEKFALIAPKNLRKTFFTNSGTEAVEAALKFSRKFTGKDGILALNGGYHGKTFGSLSVTYNEKYRKSFLPLFENVKFVSYSEMDSIINIVSNPENKIGTMIVEPIQGETGIIMPPQNFLKNIRNICTDKGIVLIFDEIQSGLGRTGKMWAGEHWDVEPDVMCLAKGIAGGVPMGVTTMRSEILDCLKIGEHSSTFAGNPLACAAGSAAIDALTEDNLVENSSKVGKLFKEGLLELKAKHKIVRDVRGLGLMLGIEMRFDVKDILLDGIKHGILLLYSGRNILRLLPPLVMDETEVNKSLGLIDILLENEVKRRIG